MTLSESQDPSQTSRTGEEDRSVRSGWLFPASIVTLMALAFAAPWIAAAAIETLSVESTTPIEWVPETFPPRQAYADFTAEFESGDVVIASWPGCTIDAPANDRFIEAATGPRRPRDAAGRPWFESVASARAAIERLTAAPLSLDRETAIARLQGVLVGPDGRQTCLLIGFTRAGLTDRARAVAWIRDTLLRTASVSAAELHLAGPVIDNVSVDQASSQSLNVFGGPAALIIFLLTWWSVRSLRYATLVFLMALACVGLCFVSLRICGDLMNPVLIVMPLLILTLGVSGGIHLVNYLIEAREAGAGDGAAGQAIALGWLPCSLSAGTTALGLLSLVVSELQPIRVFGFHAAIGVLATLVLLFLVIPGFFSRWPIRRRLRPGPEATPAPADWGDAIHATISLPDVPSLARQRSPVLSLHQPGEQKLWMHGFLSGTANGSGHCRPPTCVLGRPQARFPPRICSGSKASRTPFHAVACAGCLTQRHHQLFRALPCTRVHPAPRLPRRSRRWAAAGIPA